MIKTEKTTVFRRFFLPETFGKTLINGNLINKGYLHFSSVSRALGAFGEASLTNDQGLDLLYDDFIIISVSVPNNNYVCIPYYISRRWAVQCCTLEHNYATGTFTVNTIYADREFYR